MKIDSRETQIRGMLWDLDKGKPIRKAIWFDIETGEFEAFRIDEQGNILRTSDGIPIRYIGKTRLHFYPRQEQLSTAKEHIW